VEEILRHRVLTLTALKNGLLHHGLLAALLLIPSISFAHDLKSSVDSHNSPLMKILPRFEVPSVLRWVPKRVIP